MSLAPSQVEQRAVRQFQPLRVTAWLLDGRVASGDLWMPLDGILAAAWMRARSAGAAHLSRGTGIFDVPLPLARRGAGANWYWAASFCSLFGLLERINTWHKQMDVALAEAYMTRGKTKVHVHPAKGLVKVYQMPLIVRLAPKLEWYCVGDQAALLRLLRYVPSVGKKAAQGYGAVNAWVVEPWSEDLSGRRLVPDERGSLVWGIRPPYWYRRNQRACRDGAVSAGTFPLSA